MFDQRALMKLLAPRQHGLAQRHAHRSAEISCKVNQRRGLIGLGRWNAVVGRGRDRNQNERQADAEIDASRPDSNTLGSLVPQQRRENGSGRLMVTSGNALTDQKTSA
jgi:hypothetical protein